MKTLKSLLAALLLGPIVMFQACEKDIEGPQQEKESILPTKFKIDIPNSISNEEAAKKMAKSTKTDTLNGNEIYSNLPTFIAVGESAADIVEDIIIAINVHNINEAMSLSFEGDDDGRVKNLTVVEGASYGGKNYEFKMSVTDADSEGEADGGNAMQIFWNQSPIEGVAILKPYNIDRQHDREWLDAVFRIEYSEVATTNYDAYMIIEIADLPMPDPRLEPFALNSLKMYVGKKGDIINVYGNSDHPNAKFFTEDIGFSWAFVASGSESNDIAVAELGLPPSSLNESSRSVLLEDYSIKNVFTDKITEWFYDEIGIGPDANDLSNYLRNADAPGYFDSDGFIQGGTSPGNEYDDLVTQIQGLTPFNPKAVNELEIQFQ